MDFDEVSTVDVPANQHGLIVLAKRASQEENVADYFDEDGQPIEDEVEEGSLVFNQDGQAYQVADDGEGNAVLLEVEDDGEDEDDRQPVGVGKSAFGAPYVPDASEEIFKQFSEELRKAVSDQDRDAVLAKAFAASEKRASVAESRLGELEQIAKAEQDLRLEREYIAKAAEYGMPIPDEEFGPVLKRCAQFLSDEDCQVLHKAFSATGAIFEQLGLDGSADMYDPYEQIEAIANGEYDRYAEQGEQVAKRDGRQALSKEAATTAYFDEHPEEYARIRAERMRG
jgi:hypothetical protein